MRMDVYPRLGVRQIHLCSGVSMQMVQPFVIITYLWQELLELFKSGHLVVPEGVKVVFTDAGKGHIDGLDDFHLADGL